jgi:hypothetical protein
MTAIDMSVPLPKITMCQPCSAAWHAWLDAPMATPPIRLDGTGIRTVRDVREAQQRRADDHYALVRRQQELIIRICAARHQGEATS